MRIKTLLLEIPDSIATAIRLPEEDLEIELRKLLALSLYSKNLLSFGKARELARLSKYEFSMLLGSKDIPRHYGSDELLQDLNYASS